MPAEPPIHLTGAYTKALPCFGHHDRVGAHMAHHTPGEAQISPLFGIGLAWLTTCQALWSSLI